MTNEDGRSYLGKMKQARTDIVQRFNAQSNAQEVVGILLLWSMCNKLVSWTKLLEQSKLCLDDSQLLPRWQNPCSLLWNLYVSTATTVAGWRSGWWCVMGIEGITCLHCLCPQKKFIGTLIQDRAKTKALVSSWEMADMNKPKQSGIADCPK